MAEFLYGQKAVADLKEDIEILLESEQMSPLLCTVRVGDNESDIAYEKSAVKKCNELGIQTRSILLPVSVTTEEMLDVIDKLNQDESIHGVLMFRPLPKHLKETMIRNRLLPEKDIDGMTRGSLGGLFCQENYGYPPCTAEGCMEILDSYGYRLAGKTAVVIGRSLVIGKPVSMLLLRENATVTICHTQTHNLKAVCKEADILVVAAGKPGLIGKEFVRPGQVVIDVGIHVNSEGKLCGDVKTDEVAEIVDAITPVPGGVGSVTTYLLAKHVVMACLENKHKRETGE